MSTDDEGADNDGPDESAEVLPEAPPNRPTLQEWLVIFGAPLAICAVLALPFRSALYVLFAGRSATVVGEGPCVKGGGITGPASSCQGSWQFADGSSGSGTIHSLSAGTGDTVLAAGGWAYSSLGSVWHPAGIYFFIVAVSVVANTITWVSHFRQDRRERTRTLREPFG
ncbi:hypothetical protein [Streptomyces sp. ITFR-16]|uniref:hypothetical protein n=1 Tax=Streptomyces sp. ITFR-16 TaxID=3075198 RepID=UPI00288A83C9|nr:hypothetical protein [Streptomyces sp. ITFR-16]WNI24705.1 hypothetical protein RLT58_23665 [Streptomyces sp. ITFR-16]